MATYSIQWEPSPTQSKVITLICDGLTNEEIAARLGIKGTSIKNLVSAIYNKVGVAGDISTSTPGSCRVRLVRWAIKNKVVSV